jgi:hypothetical protein
MGLRPIIPKISGRHEPQLVPAPVTWPTASTLPAPAAMARLMVRAPTFKHAHTIGPDSA